ncbi:MAG: ligase-associated DNA damage response endonuclease PdeM [Alphaproteobacteria bacterium]
MSDLSKFPGVAVLDVGGERLLVDPLGGLYWPKHKLLAVADLHLEKGAAFAARGQPLPPYDTPDTLSVVEKLIATYAPATLVALGDSFHRADSHLHLEATARQRLATLTGGCRWVWIAGNHDPAPPLALGGEWFCELTIDALTFRHEPMAGATTREIAGHLHPVAKIRTRGRAFRRRCFVASPTRVVMPALGAYAGGLNVLDPAFAPLFPGRNFHAWMLSEGKVHRFAANKLHPDRRAA